MVTHPRPVFAAIWFVMVVVCSAGMFLLLDAEFMAFSLVIVYAGAILITYLFVLMLAQEATGSAGEALYDRLPREPIAALVVGFVLLASIGDALSWSMAGSPSTARIASRRRRRPAGRSSTAFPGSSRRRPPRSPPGRRWPTAGPPPPRSRSFAATTAGPSGSKVASRRSTRRSTGSARSSTCPTPPCPPTPRRSGGPSSRSSRSSLEVAGVILLMAMFGAVVLARRQIDLGEDERRLAAGLGPLLEEEDSDLAGGAS